MALTVRLSDSGRAKVAEAYALKRWNKHDKKWLKKADVSSASLQRFWKKQPIKLETFMYIVKAVDIADWKSLIHEEDREKLPRNEDPPCMFIMTGHFLKTEEDNIDSVIDAFSNILIDSKSRIDSEKGVIFIEGKFEKSDEPKIELYLKHIFSCLDEDPKLTILHGSIDITPKYTKHLKAS